MLSIITNILLKFGVYSPLALTREGPGQEVLCWMFSVDSALCFKHLMWLISTKLGINNGGENDTFTGEY